MFLSIKTKESRMKKRKLKILFGTNDIGFRIGLYSKYLEEQFGSNVLVHSYVTYKLPKHHYETKFTYEYENLFSKPILVRWFITFYNFLRFFWKYDVFFFLSGETLLTRKLRPLEFRLYKLLGKRIVMLFVGADIRSPKYLQWKSEHIFEYLKGTEEPKKTEPFQDKLIRDARKFAEKIFVSTPDLLDIIPEAEYFPVMLDIEQFSRDLEAAEPFEKPDDEIWILHAPSGPVNKGSKHIHHVLRIFEKESNCKVKLVIPTEHHEAETRSYTLTRYDLLRYYKSCDIVIDQMIIGWYGMQSVEALYAGCKVICYIDEKYFQFLDKDSPIIISSVENLLKTLHGVVRQANNKNGSEWIMRNHLIAKQESKFKFLKSKIL